MGRLLYLLRDICQLRRGPQDLPYSPRLLLGACAAFLLLQWVIARARGAAEETLGIGALLLAFNFGVLYLMLNLRGVSNRFVQAALALVCCATLFSLLSLPIALMVGDPSPAPEHMSPLQSLLVLVALPIIVWKLMVDAHIFRHSLNLPFLAGLVLALLWLVAKLALGAAVAPASPGA